MGDEIVLASERQKRRCRDRIHQTRLQAGEHVRPRQWNRLKSQSLHNPDLFLIAYTDEHFHLSEVIRPERWFAGENVNPAGVRPEQYDETLLLQTPFHLRLHLRADVLQLLERAVYHRYLL